MSSTFYDVRIIVRITTIITAANTTTERARTKEKEGGKEGRERETLLYDPHAA